MESKVLNIRSKWLGISNDEYIVDTTTDSLVFVLKCTTGLFLRKKVYSLYDINGSELFRAERDKNSFLPFYRLYDNNHCIGELKKMSTFRSLYSITIEDILDVQIDVRSAYKRFTSLIYNGTNIANIKPSMFSWNVEIKTKSNIPYIIGGLAVIHSEYKISK